MRRKRVKRYSIKHQIIIVVGTGFEHYSYEMSEFKPNKPDRMNL